MNIAQQLRLAWSKISSPWLLTEVEEYDARVERTRLRRAEHDEVERLAQETERINYVTVPTYKRAITDPAVGLTAAIVRDGKLLVGRRLGSHASGVVALPGGHLEWGEEWDLSIAREVAEETGMNARSSELIAVSNNVFEDEGKHYVCLHMLVECDKGEPENIEPEKCEGWVWMTPQQLKEADTMPGLEIAVQALQKRGLLPSS